MESIFQPAELKEDFEKVYENPLEWCPLYGYIPELEEVYIQETNPFRPILNRCLKIIKEVRFNFFDIEDNAMTKYVRLPKIENMVYPYKFRADDGYSFRKLFQFLDYITLKISHDWRVVDFIRPSRNDSPYKTGRVSNLYDNGASTVANLIKVTENMVDADLEHEACKIIGNDAIIRTQDSGFLCEMYGLYTILEAWLIFTGLIYNKRAYRLTAVSSEIHERIYYVDDLYKKAMFYDFFSQYAEPAYKDYYHLEIKTAPYRNKQSKRAQIKHEKEKEVLNQRNKSLQLIATGFSKKYYKNKRYNKLHVSNIANEMIKKNLNKNLKERQLREIISSVVKIWQEKAKQNNLT